VFSLIDLQTARGPRFFPRVAPELHEAARDPARDRPDGSSTASPIVR
jgi:hypothetical protein